MASNPQIQEKCQKEIDKIFDDPNTYMSMEEFAGISFEILSSAKLKLLTNCIMETLRLFPPGFGVGRKLSSPLQISKTKCINIYFTLLIK